MRRKIELGPLRHRRCGPAYPPGHHGRAGKAGPGPPEGFEAFAFAEGVEKLEDLEPGMKLPGIVTNVTNFGAFVDVGVHQDGLVHISELSGRFRQRPAPGGEGAATGHGHGDGGGRPAQAHLAVHAPGARSAPAAGPAPSPRTRPAANAGRRGGTKKPRAKARAGPRPPNPRLRQRTRTRNRTSPLTIPLPPLWAILSSTKYVPGPAGSWPAPENHGQSPPKTGQKTHSVKKTVAFAAPLFVNMVQPNINRATGGQWWSFS